MNKNQELLPYYEELSQRVEFIDNEPYWTINLYSTKKGTLAGRIHNGYRSVGVTINKITKRIPCHRLVWFMHFGYLPNQIDHIDRNRLNNSISNLREADCAQNRRNASKASGKSSKYIGVSKRMKSGKWQAAIRINKKTIYIGVYTLEEDAAKAFDRKCISLGVAEFANLNFPIS